MFAGSCNLVSFCISQIQCCIEISVFNIAACTSVDSVWKFQVFFDVSATVTGLFWCVRNSDRSLKKDTICWLSVIQFQIPHILSSVLCEIRKISVMQLLLKDAGFSSSRIHSDPQPLYEMAWFSQSQISSYWYNLYEYFPDADEASVL